MKCEIDIWFNGRWQRAGEFEGFEGAEPRGLAGGGWFAYDVNYAAENLENPAARISCPFPVNFERHRLGTWPAFLLDLLPNGAGRRTLIAELDIADGPEADWPLLLKGASNPPGVLRIAEAAERLVTFDHPGFARHEVVERREDFIEYARNHGAPVGGSSGVQGDAPKFLLTQDHDDRWHADGALPDSRAAKHWIVKFPRGNAASDRAVLRAEAVYYKVAEELGLHVGEQLDYDNDTLFIPRFERQAQGGHVKRFGLETLASLAGIAKFGSRPSHETLVRALATHSTAPAADIVEYVLRDVVNVALGNTDNHPRNSAVLKVEGEVRLSPLYDFAPMILDDQGIARVCRWEEADDGGRPEWGKVAEAVAPLGVDAKELRQRLASFAPNIAALPELLAENGADDALVDRLSGRIKELNAKLVAARPKTISDLRGDH
jgi:serine/threonine-protein kinase HipA